MSWVSFSNATLPRTLFHSHCREMLSGGQLGEGGSYVGPRVDLPVHRYLLLRHNGAPWRVASGRKARRRMSQLELHREEDLRLFPMTTLSSMNTIYATGSPLSNRSLSPRSPFFTSRSRHIHRDPPCPLWSASSFYSSSFYGLNQERCSASIANWLWL